MLKSIEFHASQEYVYFIGPPKLTSEHCKCFDKMNAGHNNKESFIMKYEMWSLIYELIIRQYDRKRPIQSLYMSPIRVKYKSIFQMY